MLNFNRLTTLSAVLAQLNNCKENVVQRGLLKPLFSVPDFKHECRCMKADTDERLGWCLGCVVQDEVGRNRMTGVWTFTVNLTGLEAYLRHSLPKK